MAIGEFRPPKLVIPEEQNIQRPEHSGGGPPKMFGDIDEAERNELNEQIGRVRRYFQSVFHDTPDLPCVARFKLKEKALAKSHRPKELFEKSSCRIIGTDNLGELLVTVNSKILDRLSRQIQQIKTTQGIANLSTIDQIEPYRVIDQIGESGITTLATKLRSDANVLRLRLFRHSSSRLDENLLKVFKELVRDLGLTVPTKIRYSDTLNIYRVEGVDENALLRLSQFAGTREISTFPTYGIRRARTRTRRPLTNQIFPRPDLDSEYPIIGVVDSGIEITNQFLEPWVVGRESYIAGRPDCTHGTFVAGLAVHAKRMNAEAQEFTEQSCKLLDVIALSESEEVSEDQLISLLEDVVSKHPEVKVWNISLSRNRPCADHAFSRIGIAFDSIQDEFGVKFVVPSGNLETLPLRGWPSAPSEDRDRLAPPADSVRCISVGSIAHRENEISLVRPGEPSPFSRRGPGPVYLPTPYVTHIGGNCDESGQLFDDVGVFSVGLNGSLTEDIGTSFAAPQVATELANIATMVERPISQNLQSAILVHSAVCRSKERSAAERHYHGFGVPGEITEFLSGDPWSISLIFQTSIAPGMEYEHRFFPFPQCLRRPDGRVFGEILMTLVYDPPLDSEYASEYCRANVDVSLGTHRRNAKGKLIHTKQIPMDPPETSQWYESQQIQHGYKWSPIKVYRRRIHSGVLGENWRLKVTANYRSEYISDQSQPFALVITLRDPDQERPVYDQTVALMREIGWKTQDLQIRDRIRTLV